MQDGHKGSLKHVLTRPDLIAISMGAMISSGLFILPGLAFSVAGPAVFLAFLIAGLLAVPACFSKAELVTAMPKAGGIYYFLDRALGPLGGTLAGFSAWLSLSVKSAFAFFGMSEFLKLLVPSVPGKLIAICCCLVFTSINLRSTKHTGRLQVIFVGILVSILLGFVVIGFGSVNLDKFTSFAPGGFSGVFFAAALVFVSFGGLTKTTSMAEEAKNPSRDIPFSMFFSLGFVILLYFLVVIVTTGVLPGSEFQASNTPLSDAASVIAGQPGFLIMAFAAMLAFMSTGNAGILASARFPLAMSRDKLLPPSFGKISTRRGTPYISILATSVFMCMMLLLDFKNLVKVASALKLLLFLFVNFAVIVMRESRIHTYRPKFRSPGYPWVQIVGIAGMILLLFKIGLAALISTGAVLFGGAIWYFLYSRKRVERESALLHLAARIFPRELARDGLVRELKQVLLDRDSIVEDRFDKLVGKAVILDLEDTMKRDDFLLKAAESISQELKIDPQDLLELLQKREDTSTTALRPGLAIPHVIVPGQGLFSILLARCREGIDFGGENSPVRMVFVLTGSADERQFHLRVLMAIAQITSLPDFDNNWLNCSSIQELRDLVLLAQRRRDTC